MYRFGKLENLLEKPAAASLVPPAMKATSQDDFWANIKAKLDEIQRAALAPQK